jgi:hypothetical protein
LRVENRFAREYDKEIISHIKRPKTSWSLFKF